MKGIIFDLDGTLVNTAFIHKEAWEEALAKLGLKSEVKVETLLGRKTAEIAKILAPSHWEELMRVKNEIYLKLIKHKARKRECADELINKARKLGYKIAIVTSSNRISATSVVSRLELYPDLLITSDDVVNGKPHPEGVLLALEKLNLKPKLSIGVGDTEVDVLAFINAGLGKIILVKSEVPINEERVKSMGAEVVNSLCDILNQLN